MGLALVAVWAAAIASPGPDLLVIIRAAARERRAAIQAALGVVCGITIWIVAAQLGVVAIVSRSDTARIALQLAGGAFLLAMGLWGLRSLIRARRTSSSPDSGASVESADAAGRSPFVAGLITNVANPKALIFFGALFVQFAPSGGALSYIVTAAVMIAMAVLWFLGVAMVASHPAVVAKILRSTAVVDAVACLIFIVLGVVMVVEAIVALG